MRSIRKFAYAAVLSLSMFTLHPTLAAAEDAQGSFTLSHEVRWGNQVLRPGDYTFSVKATATGALVALRGLNGGTDATLLVIDVEHPKQNESSRLVLVSRGGQSFVSVMELPGFDMSLRFAVPRDSTAK